jgi:hypothetical protein
MAYYYGGQQQQPQQQQQQQQPQQQQQQQQGPDPTRCWGRRICYACYNANQTPPHGTDFTFYKGTQCGHYDERGLNRNCMLAAGPNGQWTSQIQTVTDATRRCDECEYQGGAAALLQLAQGPGQQQYFFEWQS